MFPFTFNINVAGLSNPFAQVLHLPEKNPPSVSHTKVMPRAIRPPSFTGFSDPTTLSALARPSRKRARGWEVPIPEATLSTTSLESTGSFDKPSKYRKMADGNAMRYDDNEALDNEDLPPAKRRRTIAGSILSTAISAALYGSAVGLTVFRLWRGRGEERAEEMEQPPPPYQQGSWIEPEPEPVQVAPTTPTPRNRARHHITPKSASRRRRQARPPLQRHTTSPTSTPVQPVPRPEFDFSVAPEDEGEPDEQMDWLGSKLAAMIEEGKKALNREVVVQSETQEDEVDDGSDAWVDDQDSSSGGVTRHRRRSSRGSLRRSTKRPRSITVSTTGHHDAFASCLSASPRASEFNLEHPTTPHHLGTGTGDGVVESPELREQMEAARARVLARIRA